MRTVLRTAQEVEAISQGGPACLFAARTIYDALKIAAATAPSKTAIVQMGADGDTDWIISFNKYYSLVHQAANLFRAATEGSPPVVAVIAPYLAEALISMWGGATAGRYVPINPLLDVDHAAAILNAAGANILVIATLSHGSGVWDREEALVAKVPSLRKIYRIDKNREAGLLAEMRRFRPDALDFIPSATVEDECAFLHTGGTTAAPKLVRHTHGKQLLQAWLCGTAMGSEHDAVVAHAMPNFHVGGAIAMGLRGILFSQTLVTLTADGFRNPAIVPAFWEIVARYGITSITAAPTTAAAILAANGKRPSSLRQFTTGGGPLSPHIARAFEDRFGLPLCEVWGGTEFHGILSFHYGGDVPPRLGSCGRPPPFHRVMAAILDGCTFVRTADRGERGALIACGPTTISGYFDPANDARFFIEGGPEGKRWATTGDIGTVDEDGFIWISGREKDVIIRGGHNIDSALIDEVLVRHPAVLHAGAVGWPSATKGELPVAYVQLGPGIGASEEELLLFARAHIQERAAVPVQIIILDTLPMTAVGKVSKPALRLDALRRAVQALCPTATVEIDEAGSSPTVVIRSVDGDPDEALLAALAPFTFPFRIERPDEDCP